MKERHSSELARTDGVSIEITAKAKLDHSVMIVMSGHTWHGSMVAQRKAPFNPGGRVPPLREAS